MTSRTLALPPRAPEFDIVVRAGIDYIVVAPYGELDLLTAPQLEAALARAERRAKLVVLDLRGLTFASAAGMKAVLDAHLRSQACLTLVLEEHGAVRRAFELAGLAGRLPFTPVMPGWALAPSATTPRAA